MTKIVTELQLSLSLRVTLPDPFSLPPAPTHMCRIMQHNTVHRSFEPIAYSGHAPRLPTQGAGTYRLMHTHGYCTNIARISYISGTEGIRLRVQRVKDRGGGGGGSG